jgi:hypothetical protein
MPVIIAFVEKLKRSVNDDLLCADLSDHKFVIQVQCAGDFVNY